MFCLGLVLVLPGAALAAPDQDSALDDAGVLTLQFSNDLFAGVDRHFTHGTRAAWQSPEGAVPAWIVDTARAVPLFNDRGQFRVAYSLGQDIFTPDGIEETALIPEDRPYAGWLYGGIGLSSADDDQVETLELNIGVVGPASAGRLVQRRWHGAFNLTEPEGWDNQLENEPGVVLYYERKWRALAKLPLGGLIPFEDLAVDFSPHLGAALGNVYTYAAAGFTLRLGDDLPNDFGPPRIRPGLPGSDFFLTDDAIGWYLFAGLEGRAVARNIFLDGNTFRDSHSVDKHPLVGDVQAGLAFTLDRYRLAYTHMWRTKEFQGQDAPDQLGTVSLSVRF